MVVLRNREPFAVNSSITIGSAFFTNFPEKAVIAGNFALQIDRLYEIHAVLHTGFEVHFAECRSHVYDTCPVFHGDKIGLPYTIGKLIIGRLQFQFGAAGILKA